MLLRKSGYKFTTTAEKEVVRIIKEKTCYVAPISLAKEEKDTNGKFDDFTLPDGNIIKVD
jgi:centractin